MSLGCRSAVRVTIVSEDGSEKYEFYAKPKGASLCHDVESFVHEFAKKIAEKINERYGTNLTPTDIRSLIYNILGNKSNGDIPDPTWNVHICAGCWALYGLNLLDVTSLTLKGQIKDSNGNTYDLNDVSCTINAYPTGAPTIIGNDLTSASVTFTGKITPSSDICMYEMAFWIEGQISNTSATWLAIDIKNDSGAGSGVTLKANRTYTIQVQEQIQCPNTVDVPAPDGTC